MKGGRKPALPGPARGAVGSTRALSSSSSRGNRVELEHIEPGGIRCRRHPLCRFLAGRQELLIGEEVFVEVQEQRGQQWGLGETIARRPRWEVPCQSSPVTPGETRCRKGTRAQVSQVHLDCRQEEASPGVTSSADRNS